MRHLTRFTAIVVMLSIAGFSAASLVTLHYHILDIGLIVVHSHPLPEGNHNNSHRHSEREYAVLDAASQTLEKIVLEPVLDTPIAECSCGRITFDPVSISISTTTLDVSKRGPPSLFFS